MKKWKCQCGNEMPEISEDTLEKARIGAVAITCSKCGKSYKQCTNSKCEEAKKHKKSCKNGCETCKATVCEAINHNIHTDSCPGCAPKDKKRRSGRRPQVGRH